MKSNGIYLLVSVMESHEKMFSCRAQNNFWTVARQDDRPEKFLLGHVSFLTGQNVGQKC